MATRADLETPGPFLAERYRALIDHMRHAVVELDGEGRILDMNRVGLEWAGAGTPDDVIGTAFAGLAAEYDRHQVAAKLRRAFQGEEVQFRYADEDGARYATSLVPIREGSEVSRVLALTESLTDELGLRQKFTELEAHHSLILESAGEGVYGLDATAGSPSATRPAGHPGMGSRQGHRRERPRGAPPLPPGRLALSARGMPHLSRR